MGRKTEQTDFVAKERIINQQNTRYAQLMHTGWE
jgi:hypothetical protein